MRQRLGGTLSGALSNLAAQGIPFLLLIVVTPILLRSLGRAQYGALILFNLLPQIAGQLDLGLSTAATRGFTQYSARGQTDAAHRLFREALALSAAWGALLGAAFYACHPAIADFLKLDTIVGDHSPVYVASALAIPLALMNAAMLVPLRALERYEAIARIQVVVGVVYWTASAWWAPRGGALTQLVTFGTVTVATGTLALYFVGRRVPTTATAPTATAPTAIGPIAPQELLPTAPGDAVPPLPVAPDVAATPGRDDFLLRPFLRLGAGAFVAQASSLATYHADKLLVAALISPAAAGAYAICTSIANKILLVVASGATFTFPRAARLHAAGDHPRVAATYAFSTRVSLLVAACLAVPLAGLAPAFLTVWIGPAFALDYASTLRLLVIGYAITASSVVASNVAVGIGEVALPATFAVVGGVVTVASVAVLAPRFGAPGAAAAAVIGMTQSLVFNGLVADRLGFAARDASWPLVYRIAIIAIPLAFVAGRLDATVHGWAGLFLAGALVATAFCGLWLATFGRIEEPRLLRRLVARARGATDLR